MQNWKFAISSIMSHKLRSFLTMVGIIIGVASVVVIMALGDGMKAGVTQDLHQGPRVCTNLLFSQQEWLCDWDQYWSL